MIRYSAEAEADLERIDSYLTPRAGIAITNRVLVAILDSVDRLGPLPTLGQPGRRPGTRELVMTRYPYIVIYRVAGADVEIARILHTAQDWPPTEAG